VPENNARIVDTDETPLVIVANDPLESPRTATAGARLRSGDSQHF